ncbi:hypothetical protein FRC12_004359 [Ceratobasidium sp. 428]|nr:hypothetical protein FRC12_004359 [Ceratobasidium sp. 428]
MSRALRNGRSYDTGKVPPKRKRATRKTKKTENGESNEDTVTNELTVPNPSVPDPPAPVQNPASGMAFGSTLTPRQYLARMGRVPPIRRVAWRDNDNVRTDDPQLELDARIVDADAERASVRSADHPAETEDRVSEAGDKAAGPSAEQSTPFRGVVAYTRSDNGEEEPEIYYTAKTSRTNIYDTKFLGMKIQPQYSVRNDEEENEENTDIERPHEVQRAEAGEESELPDIRWFEDHWSRSNYLSASRSNTAQDADTHQDPDEDINVNALIYEVDDDYVFSDEQYSEVLQSLRDEASRASSARTSNRSQTSGAGPSRAKSRQGATVEEATDAEYHRSKDSNEEPRSEREDNSSESDVHIPSVSESLSDPIGPKGKGKEPEKKKKKRKARPSLGLNIDELKQPDKSKAEKRKKTHRYDTSRLEQTPVGFRSGGYLEKVHGGVPKRTKRAAAADNSERRGSRAESSRSARTSRAQSDRTQSSRRTHNTRSSSGQTPVEENRRDRHAERGGRRPAPSEPSDGSDPSGDDDYVPHRRMSGGGSSEDSDRSGRTPVPSSRGDPDPEPSGSSSDSDDEGSRSDSGSETSRAQSSDDKLPPAIRREIERIKRENRKLKEKVQKQAKSGYKAQAPKVYDGEKPHDMDKFEHFVFNYDNWVLEIGLNKQQAVSNVSRFLDGKAMKWYMANVAPDIHKNTWNMKKIY